MPVILDTSNLGGWKLVRKVQPIRAKPMVTLLVDKSVMSKFLVDTLEAKEPISPDSLFCIGQANDAWQQSAKALLRKYTVVGVDAEGWMICEPKPDGACLAIELAEDLLLRTFGGGFDPEAQNLYIKGKWGETIGEVSNLQRFSGGDFLLRDREDAADRWIVRRRLFMNTYTVLE